VDLWYCTILFSFLDTTSWQLLLHNANKVGSALEVAPLAILARKDFV
jgi:hypothetical protein